MSFDEEDDHYMSKADFAIMCDEIKKLSKHRDELLVAAKDVIYYFDNVDESGKSLIIATDVLRELIYKAEA